MKAEITIEGESMKTVKVTRAAALDRIYGWITNGRVIYYDDATERYYVGPESDIDYLCDLMSSDDDLVASDAFSHWCAGTAHGDGYETQEQAESAAAAK